MIVNNQRHIHNCELSKKGILSYSYSVDIDKLIGKNLRRIRGLKNISQERLAELINTPATRLSAYETGREGMGKDIMMRVCKALKIKPYEFYLDIDAPVIIDEKENELLRTYREAKELGGAVAEKIPQYGRFVILETKKTKRCGAGKGQAARYKSGG